MIVEAWEYPWSALGRVNTGGRGYCTGILVSPSHVLASAPCLYNSIEGRWWHTSEVHFVAGYQRDRYLANSPVSAYQAAPAYDPRAGASLGNIANTWALITLGKPIGQEDRMGSACRPWTRTCAAGSCWAKRRSCRPATGVAGNT